MVRHADTPLCQSNTGAVRPGPDARSGRWQGDCTPASGMARSVRERTVRRVAGAGMLALATIVGGGCAAPGERAELSEPVPVILAQGSSWELVLPGAGAQPGLEQVRNAQALGYGRPASPASVTTDPAPRIEDRRYLTLPRQPDRVLLFPPESRGRR